MRLFFILAAVCLVSLTLLADYVTPTTEPTISGTLSGLEKDTLTWMVPEWADVLLFQVVIDSGALTVATDSLAAWYRAIARGSSLHRPGSVEPVNIIKADGTQTLVLDWTPGAIYTLAVDPFGAPYQQIILQGSAGDTSTYTAICIPLNTK